MKFRYFFSSSSPSEPSLDIFLQLFPRYSACSNSENLVNNLLSTIFIIFDDHAYQLGLKTVLPAIIAFLFGLLGFVTSTFALGIISIVPAMRTRPPPFREPNHRHLLRDQTPNKFNRPGFVASSAPIPQALPQAPLGSKSFLIRRAASFPDLHKTFSEVRPLTAPRHVTFNLETPEFYHTTGLARSISMSPSPTIIKPRWPPQISPFFKRRWTHGDALSASKPVWGQSNTTVCSHTSPSLKNSRVHDLPLWCFDEHWECHRRPNLAGCDEHGMINRPQVNSLSEATFSKRSSFPMSLRLPSVRKPFTTKRRPATISSRTPPEINVSAKKQSPNKALTPDSSGKMLPSPRAFSPSSEVHRAEHVSPIRTNNAEITPKFHTLKPKRRSRFSFSRRWSSPTPGGLLPDLAPSTTSSASVFTTSPSALRKTFARRFIPFFKSPAPSSTLGFSSPSSSSQPQVDVTISKGILTPRFVPRTQPYGPPWNALMPRHDLDYSSLDEVPITRPHCQ